MASSPVSSATAKGAGDDFVLPVLVMLTLLVMGGICSFTVSAVVDDDDDCDSTW